MGHIRLGIAAWTDGSVKDRHACEVRHILTMRAAGRNRAIFEYFEAVGKKRGPEALKRLKADCGEQWALGNRGEWGTWIQREKAA